MSARQIRQKGFTLVEILIVVVILGILAAIVIPQFTSASETAKASNLISQLQTIRSQLELYQVQHGGDYPALASLPDGATTFWDQMTKISDSTGECYANPAAVPAGTTAYGPYLQKPPANKFVKDTLQTTVAATGADCGWKYEETTGKIWAVIPSDRWTDLYELGLGTVDDETSVTENADVTKGSTTGT